MRVRSPVCRTGSELPLFALLSLLVPSDIAGPSAKKVAAGVCRWLSGRRMAKSNARWGR